MIGIEDEISLSALLGLWGFLKFFPTCPLAIERDSIQDTSEAEKFISLAYVTVPEPSRTDRTPRLTLSLKTLKFSLRKIKSM